MPSILCVVSEAEDVLSEVEPITFDGNAFGGEKDDG
jgi:hypothetical protein